MTNLIECCLYLGQDKYTVRSDRVFITAIKQPQASLPLSGENLCDTLRSVIRDIASIDVRHCDPEGVLNHHVDPSGAYTALYNIDQKKYIWFDCARLKTIFKAAPNTALLHGFSDNKYCVRGTHKEFYAALAGLEA